VGFSIENLKTWESALTDVWYKLQKRHIPLIALSGILKERTKSPQISQQFIATLELLKLMELMMT
jgi:hypothetical protein